MDFLKKYISGDFRNIKVKHVIMSLQLVVLTIVIYVANIYVNHMLSSFDCHHTVSGIFYGYPSTFLIIFGRNFM